jgi:uncharacterized protein YqeY
MTIVERVQESLRDAMKNRQHSRLETLRLMKAALMLKEKETGQAVPDAEAVRVLRSEVRKRQDTVALLEEHGKKDEAEASRREIEVIEEFLPRQLSEAELEQRARAYLVEHPEINHAGKLTGALKKELGDLADGRLLSEVAKRILG